MVVNKCDMAATMQLPVDYLYTSAKTGEGIDALKAAILKALISAPPAADSALVTNLRQLAAMTEAVVAMDAAQLAATDLLPHELLLQDLHRALDALDSLTGVTSTDDVLGLVFSTFCIGK